MTFWPLFLLSVRALNSHAGPLLDEYELVDLGDLPQPSLNSFSDSLPNRIFPFRVKRDLSRQQIPGGDIYRRYGQQASTLSSAVREQLPREVHASDFHCHGHKLLKDVMIDFSCFSPKTLLKFKIIMKRPSLDQGFKVGYVFDSWGSPVLPRICSARSGGLTPVPEKRRIWPTETTPSQEEEKNTPVCFSFSFTKIQKVWYRILWVSIKNDCTVINNICLQIRPHGDSGQRKSDWNGQSKLLLLFVPNIGNNRFPIAKVKLQTASVKSREVSQCLDWVWLVFVYQNFKLLAQC